MTQTSSRRTRVGRWPTCARHDVDRTRAELAEQTQVGEALVRGLVRAQLALALRLSLVVAIGLGGLPLLFAVAPEVSGVKVIGRQPAVAAARRRRVPVPGRGRLGVRPRSPNATSRTSPPSYAGRSAE